jgi:hypothetical protein
MPEHIGYLAALGIDFGWGPSATLTWIVEHLHVYSGMPWWGTIVATALLVRIAVAPLAVRQSEAMRRMAAMSQDPQYKALSGRMMAMIREGTAANNQAEFQTIRKMTSELKKEAGVRTRDMWIPMVVQIPLGFAMWRLLRTMADIPVPALETGGLLWFQDLAVADPFYILPMVNPALVYLMNRVGRSRVLFGGCLHCANSLSPAGQRRVPDRRPDQADAPHVCHNGPRVLHLHPVDARRPAALLHLHICPHRRADVRPAPHGRAQGPRPGPVGPAQPRRGAAQ